MKTHSYSFLIVTFVFRILGSHLDFISDICFSYITPQKCGSYEHGDVFPIENHPLGGIKIHMYERQPHDRVSHRNEG